MTPRLQGNAALIIGAASGIGLASAHLFCREGAAVVLADAQGERAEQEAARLYQWAGFRRVERRPGRLGGADVLEERYELRLNGLLAAPASAYTQDHEPGDDAPAVL